MKASMSTGQTNRVTLAAGGYDEPVITGEAVALELRPAGIASRGVALLIDFAVQGAATLVLVLIATAAAVHMNEAAALTVILVLYVLVVLGYPVGFETFAHGRTLGKMALGLRVVRDDGGPIRFRHALVRGLVGVVLERPGVFFCLPALVCMLSSRRSKRLGDLAAGTIVLQERVPAHVEAPPPMPPQLAAWAAALDLSRVDDDLALQVRQFLGRARQLAPWARDDIGARLVAELTARTGAAPPPGAPGWAYLSAVLAERRRRELARITPTPAPATTQQATALPSAPPPPPAPGPTPGEGPFAPPG
jgi:uncharacterized RDD family membrane protein YckC